MESQLSSGRSVRNGLGHTGKATAPMSLSMKLRAESAAASPSRPATTTQNLPRLTIPTNRMMMSQSGNIHLKKPAPKSDVAKLYDRLSGSYESVGFESFPYQETICHPMTLCVRCASHASLCVPCADQMSQEAVEFFRRSQAVGAYHLLNGAIKQAGGEKVLRFVIFRCWKNSIQLRKYGRGQRDGRTVKRYQDLILKDPFRAWVKFTKDCQIERRDKKELQLEERIKVLEQQVNKFTADKANTDKQIRLLQMAKSDADDEIRKLKSLLKDSEEVIQEERLRVLKVTKIVEEISPRLLGAIQLSLEATLTTTLRHINLTSNFHQSSLNLSRLAKATKSSSLRESTSLSTRRSTNKGVSIPETGPIPTEGSSGALLLSWMNSISKTISGLTIPAESGHSVLLEDYLAPYQEIKSLETLKNGQQISRVVFRLISQSIEKTSSLLPTQSSRSAKRQESGIQEKKLITLEKMTLLREIQSTPRQLYCVLFEYLQGYFPSSPLLPLDRILAGKVDSIEILLSELLFLWCGMDGHALFIDERNEIQKLNEKQQKHLQDIQNFLAELGKTKLFHFGLKSTVDTSQTEGKEENKAPPSSTSPATHAISFDMSSYLSHNDTYETLAHHLDDYFTRKSPDEFFKLFSEFQTEIQSMNEFVNTVYLKEKLASNGLQYLIDTQRIIALGNIQKMAMIEEDIENNHRVDEEAGIEE